MSDDRTAEAHHGSLFPELRAPPFRPPAGPEPATGDSEPPPPADDRQLLLFSDFAVLRRDLEHALLAADFDEARRLRRTAVETYGGVAWDVDFEFLDLLGPELWQRPTAHVLARWQEADARLAGRATLRAGVRDAVFRRLLDGQDPATLATARPDLVGPLCAALGSLQEDRGRTAARALVRDLLLEGREIDPGGFEHDGPVADLLSEDLPPAWLACLGALRRLWPTPPIPELELAGFAAQTAVSSSDAVGASEFWKCLRVARTPGTLVAVLHEARRRMKALNPHLHALHMGEKPCPHESRRRFHNPCPSPYA